MASMKAMAISEFAGGISWASERSSWHYSPKRSQSIFHPVNVSQEEQFTTKPKNVSRSLFGPSDPVESRRLVREEFNSQRCSDRSRWNFDFYQEKPISGRYDWHKVSKVTKHSDQHLESLWTTNKSPKSPKKFSSEDFNASGSWSSSNDDSGFRSKSSSPVFKKKTY